MMSSNTRSGTDPSASGPPSNGVGHSQMSQSLGNAHATTPNLATQPQGQQMHFTQHHHLQKASNPAPVQSSQLNQLNALQSAGVSLHSNSMRSRPNGHHAQHPSSLGQAPPPQSGNGVNGHSGHNALGGHSRGGHPGAGRVGIDHQANMKNMGVFVQQQDSYAAQMSLARSAMGPKGDDYDPDSNVYVANLPSDYGKDRLYQLFAKFGSIVRYKFVTPDESTQPGYGFVQFANRKDAHTAIKNLEGHQFATGETIYLSIALRRRSSLSDEPTNLYVKNLPSSWDNDKLRQVFGAYGPIRQSKVVGDGIAFVRFDDHEQALNAIGRLDKQMVEQGCQLEVRFATRKTAANAYRLQQVPQSKSNENNLYIRNLPKNFTQSSLEQLFQAYGKISSAKINDNGIAFVRFAHAEHAKRAIQELNGKRPHGFEEEIVVKLAHFDIGDSRNRWDRVAKYPNMNGGGGPYHRPFDNHLHHAPFGYHNGGPYHGGYSQNGGNHGHSSMNPHHGLNGHSGINSPNPALQQQQQQRAQQRQYPMCGVGGVSGVSGVNGVMSGVVNPMPGMGGVGAVNGTLGGMGGAMNMNNGMGAVNGVSGGVGMNNMSNMNVMGGSMPSTMGMNGMNGMNMLQQQVQQMNLGSASNTPNKPFQGTASASTQFAFPSTALTTPSTGSMVMAPNLFGSASNTPNQALQPQSLNNGAVTNGSDNSPQSSHSGGSNPGNAAIREQQATWSSKQRKLGDVLYTKVLAQTGTEFASKITGMLLKMGDISSQKCINDPTYLQEQLQKAKQLLAQQDAADNNVKPVTPNATTPLGRYTINSPNSALQGTPNRFQALTTTPLTPNATLNGGVAALSGVTGLNAVSLPNNGVGALAAGSVGAVNGVSGMNGVSTLNSMSTLFPSIPNSVNSMNSMNSMGPMYGGMPNLLHTPQLLTVSPNPAGHSTSNGVTNHGAVHSSTASNGGTGVGGGGMNGVNGVNGTAPQTPNATKQTALSPNVSTMSGGTPTPYLFTTIPNLGASPMMVTSPSQQALNMGTPKSQHNGPQQAQGQGQGQQHPQQQQPQAQQQPASQQQQQLGWGLANQVNGGNMNVIPTQPATNFMQPQLYPRATK